MRYPTGCVRLYGIQLYFVNNPKNHFGCVVLLLYTRGKKYQFVNRNNCHLTYIAKRRALLIYDYYSSLSYIHNNQTVKIQWKSLEQQTKEHTKYAFHKVHGLEYKQSRNPPKIFWLFSCLSNVCLLKMFE